MKRILALTVVLLCLCGCAASEQTWEYVRDSEVYPVGSYLDEAYTMFFELPSDAQCSREETTAARQVYAHENGDYELIAETMLCSSMQSAVRRLTGFEASGLQVIQTKQHGLDEYQFAWYTNGDEGGKLCRADIVFDGIYCYALSFYADEQTAMQYDTTADEIFASFSLYFDEKI